MASTQANAASSHPSARAPTGARLTNLFNPARKPIPGRGADPRHVSLESDYGPDSPISFSHLRHSPGDISTSPHSSAAYGSALPTMQSGVRRSRDASRTGDWATGKAAASNMAVVDNDYVPYNGPISPPGAGDYPRASYTKKLGSSLDRVNDDRRKQSTEPPYGGHSHFAEHAISTPPNLIGLGFMGTGVTPAARQSERDSGHLSAQAISPGAAAAAAAASAAAYHSENKRWGVTHTGLPSAYTHGGNAPSDWAHASRSAALPDNLPSLMRFDKEREVDAGARLAGGFRREPFYGSPSFTHQQQHSQQPFQYPRQQQTSSIPMSVGRSAQGRSEMTATASPLTKQTSLASGSRAGSGRDTLASSAASSPAIGVTQLPSRIATADSGVHKSSSQHHKGSSLTSSEGHGSSLMFAAAGTHGSASTSVTSFRDATGNKATRTSIEQHRLRAGGSNTGLRHHHQTASRSTMASSAPSDRPKTTTDDAGPTPFVSAPSSQAVESTDSAPHLRRSTIESVEGVDDASAQPLSHRALQSLSPITASSPGTSQVTPNERFERFEITSDERPTPAALPKGKGRVIDSEVNVQPQVNKQNSAPVIAAGPVTQAEIDRTAVVSDEEIRRRYFLLQQLHLDELAAHSVQNNGWLEPKNGCERVLMPRPSLHGLSDSEQWNPERRQRASTMAAFERSRRMPLSYESEDESVSRSGAARAQKALSPTGNPRMSTTSDGERRFFHHRMPPTLPDVGLPSESGWYSVDERPAIPKRTSSRQGRHSGRRATNSRGDVPTPALTPNVMSDGEDDVHDAVTPDLATVLAQGEALDLEREQWRAEHRRSLGANHSQHRRSRSGKGRPPFELKAVPDERKRRTLRQVHSSPHLDRKAAAARGEGAPPPLPSPPLSRSCFPSMRGGHHDVNLPDDEKVDRQRRASRLRSRSMEGLSRLRSSAMLAAAYAVPCISPSTANATDKEARQSSDAGTRRRRGRAVTMSQHDRKVRSTVDEKPFVIGRLTMESGTSPGLGSGPFIFRDPAAHMLDVGSRARASDRRTSIDHYGAAISSPRPDIGHANVPDAQQFATAGRYATKRGYHRPKSSDELAAILHPSTISRSSESGDAPPEQHVSRQPITQDVTAEIVAREGYAPMERQTSLGMRQIVPGASLGTPSKADVSLPVPPRRRRLSGRGSSTEASPRFNEVEPIESAKSSSGAGQRSYVLESYAQPGAFQTPPLTQPTRDAGFFDQSSAAPRGNYNRLAPPVLRPTTTATVAHRSRQDVLRSARSTSSLGRPSSEDSASQHSRELWNTDDHGDEAFNSLFFRRPRPNPELHPHNLSSLGPGIHGSSAPSTIIEGGETTHDVTVTERRANQQLGMFDHSPTSDGTQNQSRDELDELTHDGELNNELHDLMGSLLDISRMTGSSDRHAASLERFAAEMEHSEGDDDSDMEGIDGLRSGDKSLDARPSLQMSEPAWNDSSIGDHLSQPIQPPPPSLRGLRAGYGSVPDALAPPFEQMTGVRLGRVNDARHPQMKVDEDEESGEVSQDGSGFSRPRVSSLAASVLFHAAGGGSAEELNVGESETPVLAKTAAETGTFINFASPSALTPLVLPVEGGQGSAGPTAVSSGRGAASSALLEPPTTRDRASSSIGSQTVRGSMTSSSGSQDDGRRGSEGILNMVRSRVWPEPPESPGMNELGRNLDGGGEK